jgi:hypothetical protein
LSWVNFLLDLKKNNIMQTVLRTPFSNIQQELLKMYTHQVSDEDLLNIRDIIGQYFAKRLSSLADKAWEQNNWTQQDMDDILNDPNQ